MASTRLIFEIIKRRCSDIDAPYPGYNRDLMATVMGVLGHEREHRRQQTNVAQKIEDEVEKLGDLAWQRGKNPA